jgi:hypothetical protein
MKGRVEHAFEGDRGQQESERRQACGGDEERRRAGDQGNGRRHVMA